MRDVLDGEMFKIRDVRDRRMSSYKVIKYSLEISLGLT